jgi:hypothetical protein
MVSPLYELFLVSDGPFLGELDRSQVLRSELYGRFKL